MIIKMIMMMMMMIMILLLLSSSLVSGEPNHALTSKTDDKNDKVSPSITRLSHTSVKYHSAIKHKFNATSH